MCGGLPTGFGRNSEKTSRTCCLLALNLGHGDELQAVGLGVGEDVADDEEDLRELFEVEAVLGDKRPQIRREAMWRQPSISPYAEWGLSWWR